MTWLLPLLRNQWVRGGILFVLATGFWIANVRLAHQRGYRAGAAERGAQAAVDAFAAGKAADGTRAALSAAVDAATAKQRAAEQAAIRATERGRASQRRVREALVAVTVDSTTPEPVTTLVTETQDALAAWDVERAGLEMQSAVKDTVIVTLQQIIAGEPVRTDAAVQAALVEQRATFRGPSRVTWASVGALAATIITFGVMR
jgi:hypothetical protein